MGRLSYSVKPSAKVMAGILPQGWRRRCSGDWGIVSAAAAVGKGESGRGVWITWNMDGSVWL